jgi:hypothetical protein
MIARVVGYLLVSGGLVALITASSKVICSISEFYRKSQKMAVKGLFLLVAGIAASTITHKSIHSFVDVTCASIVRTITTIKLEEALDGEYKVSLPDSEYVDVKCGKACNIETVVCALFLLSFSLIL